MEYLFTMTKQIQQSNSNDCLVIQLPKSCRPIPHAHPTSTLFLSYYNSSSTTNITSDIL